MVAPTLLTFGPLRETSTSELKVCKYTCIRLCPVGSEALRLRHTNMLTETSAPTCHGA